MLSLLVTLFTLKNSLISSGFVQAEFISLGPTSLMIFPSLLGPLHFEVLLELQIQIRPLIPSLHSTPTPAVLLCIFPFSVTAITISQFPEFETLKPFSDLSFLYTQEDISYQILWILSLKCLCTSSYPSPFFILFAIIPLQTCTISIAF